MPFFGEKKKILAKIALRTTKFRLKLKRLKLISFSRRPNHQQSSHRFTSSFCIPRQIGYFEYLISKKGPQYNFFSSSSSSSVAFLAFALFSFAILLNTISKISILFCVSDKSEALQKVCFRRGIYNFWRNNNRTGMKREEKHADKTGQFESETEQ